jgi:hypothetical protein
MGGAYRKVSGKYVLCFDRSLSTSGVRLVGRGKITIATGNDILTFGCSIVRRHVVVAR